MLIKGHFDVKRHPEALSEVAAPAGLGRFSLDKQFHGALDAHSCGEMLSYGSPTAGSAAYVAIERVEGSLDGRKGSFALQHSATMTRGEGKLEIKVVPDSGTGELVGLSGSMAIVIAEGQHRYAFDFSFA